MLDINAKLFSRPDFYNLMPPNTVSSKDYYVSSGNKQEVPLDSLKA